MRVAAERVPGQAGCEKLSNSSWMSPPVPSGPGAKQAVANAAFTKRTLASEGWYLASTIRRIGYFLPPCQRLYRPPVLPHRPLPITPLLSLSVFHLRSPHPLTFPLSFSARQRMGRFNAAYRRRRASRGAKYRRDIVDPSPSSGEYGSSGTALGM